jgi:hypothetical protein
MDKSREILLNDLTKKIELLISKYEQVRAERNELSSKLAKMLNLGWAFLLSLRRTEEQ